jgi:HK97 gp10 family phage protein
MASDITCDVSSAVKGIEDLEQKVQGQIVRQSTRAGAKVTLKPARANAPVKTGLVKRSVKISTGKRRKGTYTLNVGIPKGSEGWYGALVERGHKIGKRELGDKRKDVPGQHWIEKAYQETKDEAVDTIRETAIQLIEDAAGK